MEDRTCIQCLTP